ncbi:FHA domain-containing protein [Conexibacter sp. SYSU D00693]|uniref:FHA domain-containing protein n=1 Tax=Conexibacter sp. SYSU D00693 TaxID=2812560 RepID=UPI00196A8D9F|nr:FHA domain-containing protein [Conexibacter sp. SYSU D00693]
MAPTFAPERHVRALDRLAQETGAHDALPALSHRERSRAVDPSALDPGLYLIAESGDDARAIPLAEPVMRLGRGFTADIALDDVGVSRRHAVVVHRPGGTARILDDRSTNGTWVNGRRVTQHDLTDGDVVVLGGVVLTFRQVP